MMDESDHSKITDYLSTVNFIEMTLKFFCLILTKNYVTHIEVFLVWIWAKNDWWMIGFALHPRWYQDLVLSRLIWALYLMSRQCFLSSPTKVERFVIVDLNQSYSQHSFPVLEHSRMSGYGWLNQNGSNI